MNLLEECAGAASIGISAHVRPDGDAVGSTMALYLYLKRQLPEAVVKLFLETPPDNFRHLKYLDEIDSSYSFAGTFDVFFALDTVADRMGEAVKYFADARKKINIDHHISNAKGSGDINVIRPEVGSTAEILYDLMEEEKLDEDVAVALYTGMIHDTGIFQYSNTRPRTLEIAAKLMGFGFDFSKIIEESFYQKTYLQNQLLGRALTESICFMDGRCIFSCIDRKMMDFYQVKQGDLDGIVNQLRNTKGTDCAIFLYENGCPGEMEYKVSLRSNESVDVSVVASHFGGGGHARAAGCTMKGSVHDIMEQLSCRIAMQLKETGSC